MTRTSIPGERGLARRPGEIEFPDAAINTSAPRRPRTSTIRSLVCHSESLPPSGGLTRIGTTPRLALRAVVSPNDKAGMYVAL